MKLSKSFELSEFVVSRLASVYDLDNTPPDWAVDALKQLCEHILQPLRDMVTSPIIILSGYRCEALNVLVRGSDTSQHRLGQAADIRVQGLSVLDTVKTINKHLPFDQLIHEFDSWTHVSYSPKQRRQCLKIGRDTNGRYIPFDPETA